MSHTNHRSGSYESLLGDYAFIALGAKGINRDAAGPKIAEVYKIFTKHHPNNGTLGGWEGPTVDADTPSEAFADFDGFACHTVLTTDEDLIACLKELKEADIGISVVVSGLFDHTHECCHKAGVEPHTVNTSLGVWGKTELLPEQGVLDISTMCGHGMVTFEVIKDYVRKIKAGKLTSREAADKLSPLCTCHVFNTDRATKILEKLAEDPEF